MSTTIEASRADTLVAAPATTSAALRRAVLVRVHRRRTDLGHLVAPYDRTRHVLVAAPRPRAGRGDRGRLELRLARAPHDVPWQSRRACRERSVLGLSRPVRRLGVYLGHAHDG